ncbi:hypothetical protein ACFOEK_10975 [Litoribrevibacter euphylliae]|uniref:Uncharacterized protein n=1 Tax=Litoribrevibacter euphylliae TaxID=1834034 RepID=A0ABV7HHE7_9GAMM
MYRVNAFTQKGTKFRFRVQGDNILDVQDKVHQMFRKLDMKLVLVEPVQH